MPSTFQVAHQRARAPSPNLHFMHEIQRISTQESPPTRHISSPVLIVSVNMERRMLRKRTMRTMRTIWKALTDSGTPCRPDWFTARRMICTHSQNRDGARLEKEEVGHCSAAGTTRGSEASKQT
jgi:hypothetical protein